MIIRLPDDITLLVPIVMENDVFVKELFCRAESGEIPHTISAAKAIGMTADEFRRYLGNEVLTLLNHDREYIASREYVSEHCDRKRFRKKDSKVISTNEGIT